MRPWEKRLKDLSHHLGTCASCYFHPDLFRMNVNQVLQVSRTVTFVIQKNKSNFPNFDSWYRDNVELSWKTDPLMLWAKDSRNTIEKEGDLELNRSLRATLVFSYLEEDDTVLETGSAELLNWNIKRLLRAAQRRLPTGVSDGAVVKIERRWVCASFPGWELLSALNYVYGRVFQSCFDLGEHLGERLSSDVPRPTDIDIARDEGRRVIYVKVRDRIARHIEFSAADVNSDFIPPEAFRREVDEARHKGFKINSLRSAIDYHAKLARASFEHYASHIPIAFLFDDDWKPIDMLSTHFPDHADKYVFWRIVGERAAALRASGLVWVSELWIRDMRMGITTPIGKLPIVGERLQVIGFDKSGAVLERSWNISRPHTDGPPELEEDMQSNPTRESGVTMFFAPVMRALGISFDPKPRQ